MPGLPLILMRLFIACDIPGSVKEKLAALRERVGSVDAGIKWVEVENLHLTLKFLGEVEEGKVDEIKNSLEEIKTPPFTSSVSGFGVFPSESHVRVIWAGLEPKERIVGLHALVDSALSGLGFGPELRFEPHVTIGRVKFVRDRAALVRGIGELRGARIPDTFGIDSFKLKLSTLTPQGPVYEDIGTFELS